MNTITNTTSTITLAALALLLAAGACQSQKPGPFPSKGTFDVEHRISVPVQDGAQQVRLWFPLPRVEEGQTITDEKIEAPAGWSMASDDQGNRYVYAAITAPKEPVVVTTRFRVTRAEQRGLLEPDRTRPLTDAEKREHAALLGSDE